MTAGETARNESTDMTLHYLRRIRDLRRALARRYGPPVASCEPISVVKSVYAVVRYRNGGGAQFDVMMRGQVDAIRKRSKASGSGPWVTDYGQMAVKTVIRRVLKLVPMSIELASALAVEDRAEQGEDQALGIIDNGWQAKWEPVFVYGGKVTQIQPGARRPSSTDSWAFNTVPNSHGHPCEKPEALMREIIATFSGDVCDPFMGSGTTLRAAKDLGRKAIGIEIEERYCEIAALRMAQEVLPL